ncbi:phage portal protein [Sphingosinicella xenopeptidilytica]|uniref:Phage portal protein n=1 Tax=Sphingosinicella xenopeptidilytica TaxID=364098 RepID=A0ABW3BYJ8_SPHXN
MFGASPTAAGATVTPETAMRCPTVYGSVKVIAESVAQLPLHLYRRTADGGKERAADHPLAEILNGQANEWTSAAEFRSFMQTSLLLYGNAFAYIGRTNGVIVEMIPLPAPTVTVEVDTVTLEPSYAVTTKGGEKRIYRRQDVLHLKGLGTNPNVGLSPVTQMREAIGLSIAMEEHASRVFGGGAHGPAFTVDARPRRADRHLA